MNRMKAVMSVLAKALVVIAAIPSIAFSAAGDLDKDFGKFGSFGQVRV